jgi:hypothetical protein
MPQTQTSTQTLTQLTIRLEPIVADALRDKAGRLGQEPADYAAGVLTRAVLDVIEEKDQAAARRLQAELEIKAWAIDHARRLSPVGAFDPNVTLKVFQAIRTDDGRRHLYLRAIGDRPSEERGNPIKARINRSLGSMIKAAVGAEVEDINGNPVKVQVSGEFIFSYTLLKPAR